MLFVVPALSVLNELYFCLLCWISGFYYPSECRNGTLAAQLHGGLPLHMGFREGTPLAGLAWKGSCGAGLEIQDCYPHHTKKAVVNGSCQARWSFAHLLLNIKLCWWPFWNLVNSSSVVMNGGLFPPVCGVGLKFSIVLWLRLKAQADKWRVMVSLFPILTVWVFVFLLKWFGERRNYFLWRVLLWLRWFVETCRLVSYAWCLFISDCSCYGCIGDSSGWWVRKHIWNIYA